MGYLDRCGSRMVGGGDRKQPRDGHLGGFVPCCALRSSTYDVLKTIMFLQNATAQQKQERGKSVIWSDWGDRAILHENGQLCVVKKNTESRCFPAGTNTLLETWGGKSVRNFEGK